MLTYRDWQDRVLGCPNCGAAGFRTVMRRDLDTGQTVRTVVCPNGHTIRTEGESDVPG